LEVVEFLCQRYPAALKRTNSQHQTPLHLAVLSHAHESVIACVLQWYPTAAQLADDRGWTPTHYVCQNNSSTSGSSAANVLRLLLQENSASVASTVTRNLEKPLHIAAQSNAGEVIRVLLETKYNSSSNSSSNSNNMETTATTTAVTPSILAAVPTTTSSSNTDRVRSTTTTTTTTAPASCTDSKLFTPLHYYAMHGNWMDASILKLLIEACPQAKYMANEDDCTPFELAAQAHASRNLLALLQ
jgi:hypothetical protein